MRVKVKNNKVIIYSVGNPILLLSESDAKDLYRRLGEVLKSNSVNNHEYNLDESILLDSINLKIDKDINDWFNDFNVSKKYKYYDPGKTPDHDKL